MNLARRRFVCLAAAAVAATAVSHVPWAQAYPLRPVRIIVGFPPGGSSDIFARLIAQWLSERLGQQFVVENRPGAGGNIATAVVVNAQPDGHTLLLVNPGNALNGTLYENLPFNFVRDIAPIAGIMCEPNLVEVNPSLPASTVPEFIAYAKANPGKVNMASGGNGSLNHVFGELFQMMAGVDMVHVPYRGAGPALTDLLSGQVHVMFASMSSSIQHVRLGKLRALAVTSAKRSPLVPYLPTVNDFVLGYDAIACLGIGAPKHTPTTIIDKLNAQINAALAEPMNAARIAELGGMPMQITPAEFGRFIAGETDRWARVIRAANIKAE